MSSRSFLRLARILSRHFAMPFGGFTNASLRVFLERADRSLTVAALLGTGGRVIRGGLDTSHVEAA
jgi:hypothetical protein